MPPVLFSRDHLDNYKNDNIRSKITGSFLDYASA
jgi:hypothetical protein